MIGSMFRKAWYSDSATLSLDFTTGVLDSRLTFTRSSTATYIDSSGYVASASIDSPRFDHDPTTLAPRGLLIEKQATNRFQQSSDWTVSPWSKPAQITWDGTTYATAPDGTNTAKQITVTSGASASVSQFVSLATNRTISLWIRAGSLTSFSIGAYDTGGTAWGNNADSTCEIISGPGSKTQQTGGLWSITGLSTTEWTRVQVFRSSTYSALLAYPGSSSGTINGTAYMWGMQMEDGNGASSLIPTGASTATRDPDNCVMTGTNFSSWYNQAEGTIYAETLVTSTSGGGQLAASVYQNSNTYLDIGQGTATGSSSTTRFYIRTGGVDEAVLDRTLSPLTLYASARMAGAYRTNDAAYTLNGLSVVTDATVTLPSAPIALRLGQQQAATSSSRIIRRIVYWPTRLPNATLQSLTT